VTGNILLLQYWVLITCLPTLTFVSAMFTSEMKETYAKKIELHGVTSTGLEKVLEFVYSGEIVLSLDNIQDILAAASHLQVMAIMDFCNVSFCNKAVYLHAGSLLHAYGYCKNASTKFLFAHK